MKIRRFTDIKKEDLVLNEAFDFSDDNDGINDYVESAKMISTFEDLCWKLLDSFYQFISVHYGDPEWFHENHFGVEYFLLDDDKLPLIDSEVYLSKSFDTIKLHFTGKLGVTKFDKLRVVIFEFPLKINAKNEFLSYNKMIQLLDEARTSRDYKITLKWITNSNKSTFYPWSREEGKKNLQCIKEYVGFCNDYINTFVEAAKTPYKDIDKVRDLEGYKKKFTDLMYNFFTWLDINGKYPKPIGGMKKRFKFDFKEYGIPHMVLLGSNIFFTKNTSAVELEDTMIHVNALINPRDYWVEALKGLGKFDFSWAQVCLEGGSVDIFYEIGEALEKFLENEKAKLRSLKESFDFDDDSDNINSSIEKIKVFAGLPKKFNELFERYITEISWTDVDDIAKALDEMFSANVHNKRFEVTVKEAPIKKFNHPMKYIVLERLSDGKQYKSAYSKADIDLDRWISLHHFLHLMCIVGTCLFDGIPDWWNELVKTAQKRGWNLQGKEDIDTIYQSYFENQE